MDCYELPLSTNIKPTSLTPENNWLSSLFSRVGDGGQAFHLSQSQK